MTVENDKQTLRDLAREYAAIAAKPIQDERRKLWSDHFSLKPTRPLILTSYGMHNVWCREVFGDDQMCCEDPFYRQWERQLRMAIFRDSTGDDCIQEPFISMGAAVKGSWGRMWGVEEANLPSDMDGGAWKFDPPIKDWSDLDKLTVNHHEVDEAATEENYQRLADAIGDIIPIDINRCPALTGFCADISTDITKLRGLDQLMMDMYDSPDQLHRLLAFMRDGILQNNREAEDAGHYSLTCHQNQAMPYAHELEPPRANSGPRKRSDLWGFCAAQEYTLISPEFHDEFLFQYQMDIYKHFGLVHYGCCEDLTRKMEMLRQLPNLRSIAVTPRADVQTSAEQIQQDYAFSWRPNPADMVCTSWDEARVRRIIGDGLKAARDCCVHIHLKDIETVQGEPDRLQRWVKLVRSIIDQSA